MSPHFGPCKRPCLWFCLASSSAHSLWPASPPQTPGFIGASPTRREGANLTSDIPSGIYFSAYGVPPPPLNEKPRRGAGVFRVVRSEADQKSRWTRTRATNWSSVLTDLKMTVEPAVPSGTSAPVALLMAAIGRFLFVSTTRPLSMILACQTVSRPMSRSFTGDQMWFEPTTTWLKSRSNGFSARLARLPKFVTPLTFVSGNTPAGPRPVRRMLSKSMCEYDPNQADRTVGVQ